MDQPPLAGVTVIQDEEPAVAYAGRLFATLGARVLKLQPTAADPSRDWRTPAEKSAGLPTSSFAWYNSLGKQTLPCDLSSLPGRASFAHALASADVFLTGRTPPALTSLECAPASLLASHPRLVVTVVTPFGSDGPMRDYRASDTTLLASGGQLFLTGYPDRRPLRYGGFQGYKQGSVHAAYATLAALLERERSGRGQVVDVSMQECVANSLQTTMQLYDLTGEIRQRVGSHLVPCKDGWVRNFSLIRGWPALLEWLDSEGFDHSLKEVISNLSPSERLTAALRGRIDEAFARFFATKTKRELLDGALDRGIALAPVLDAAEILALPELEERRYWSAVADHESGRSIRVPLAPFRLASTVLVPPGPLTSGSEAAIADGPPQSGSPAVASAGAIAPLAGVFVVDFSWYGAGSMATRTLAHLGADVVKVESSQRVDGTRLGPPFRGEPGINKSGFFNNFNSAKRSITLDMRNPAARSVARDLVARADVVADNFSAGVLSSFGLSDPDIHALNPRTVILHMPMGGTWGRLSKAVGVGATIEAAGGLNYLTGDPDRPPVGTEVNYPDYGPNPYQAATAVIACLLAVRRGHPGQVVELSQLESTIAFSGEALVEYQRTGAIPSRNGNVTPECVFNELLRCAGEDEWCAVSCFTDQELESLLELANLDRSALVDLQPLTTVQHHARLAERLETFSQRYDKYRLAELLQGQGLAAYPVVTARDLLERDPQLAARKHYRVMEHPDAGRITYDGPPVRFSRTPADVSRRSPCLGEHTTEVLRDVLGLDDSAIRALADAGALL